MMNGYKSENNFIGSLK